MKKQTNLISRNLTALRQYHKYSQEEVAEKVGVTRQAVAKWESGETVPDILNCDALAELYDVSVDTLIHYDQEKEHNAHTAERQASFRNGQSGRARTDRPSQKSTGPFPDQAGEIFLWCWETKIRKAPVSLWCPEIPSCAISLFCAIC